MIVCYNALCRRVDIAEPSNSHTVDKKCITVNFDMLTVAVRYMLFHYFSIASLFVVASALVDILFLFSLSLLLDLFVVFIFSLFFCALCLSLSLGSLGVSIYVSFFLSAFSLLFSFNFPFLSRSRSLSVCRFY